MSMEQNGRRITAGLWRIPTPVAIVLVLLCVAGGVLLVRQWLKRDTNYDAMAVDAPEGGFGRRGMMEGGIRGARGDRQRPTSRQAGMRAGPATQRVIDRAGLQRMPDARPNDRPQPGVGRPNNAAALATAGGIEVRLRQTPGEPSTVILRPADGAIPPGQDDLLRSARRLLLDADLAKQMQLTDEQRNSLRQVDFSFGLKIGDKDRASLESLALEWEQAAPGAAKTAARTKLIDAMKEVGQRSAEPSRVAAQKSIDQVKAILTPQQLDAIRQASESAATRPAK